MKLEDYIEARALIAPGERVAVAFSGGSDSTVLLHALNTLRKKGGFSLCALHVEHGIRGAESVADAAFAENLCRDLEIPFRLERVDVPSYCREHRVGLEEGARELRREAFARAVSDGFCDKIATAHHLEDNAESILLHILRGSGMRGVCGMREAEGWLLRPLLGVSKDALLAYAAACGLTFRFDSTNADPAYSRNFLRLNILPKLRERFPGAERALCRLAENLSEENQLLDELARELLCPEEETLRVRVDSRGPLFKRAVLLALREENLAADVGAAHLDALCRLADQGQNGDSLNLPNGVTARLEYGYLSLERTPARPCVREFPLKPEIRLTEAITLTLEEIPCPSDPALLREMAGDGTLYLDRDKLAPDTVIRFARAGDVFQKLGGGSKKLCDHFTDRKIPVRKRKDIPLLADGNRILAVIPYEISERVKADSGSRTLLRLTLRTHSEKKHKENRDVPGH